jgi:hypothetical protein
MMRYLAKISLTYYHPKVGVVMLCDNYQLDFSLMVLPPTIAQLIVAADVGQAAQPARSDGQPARSFDLPHRP